MCRLFVFRYSIRLAYFLDLCTAIATSRLIWRQDHKSYLQSLNALVHFERAFRGCVSGSRLVGLAVLVVEAKISRKLRDIRDWLLLGAYRKAGGGTIDW